jgi:serine/threonine-protein phosphatase 6 regulatory subunit 3
MGHITLISEEIAAALEHHFPPELTARVREHVPQPDWNDYVNGDLSETKRKDTSLLGGGKPAITPLAKPSPFGEMRWRMDETDLSSSSGPQAAVPTLKSEFRRTTSLTHPLREASADFSVAVPQDRTSDTSKHVSEFVLRVRDNTHAL